MPPIATAFSQLRLSGQMVSATPDSRLTINGVKTMTTLDSGAFTSSAVVQNTGQQLYGLIVGFSGASNATFATQSTTNTLTTNLTTTGVQLGASIAAVSVSVTSLSGYANATFLPRGSVQTYRTGMATGSDVAFVSFPTGFAGAPRVQPTVEVSQPILYFVNVFGVSTSGFTAYFSDVIAETGVFLHVEATY